MWVKRCGWSWDQLTFAVLPSPVDETPQSSTPVQVAAPCQIRPRSRVGPGYSPGSALPSTTGVACGITVVGTSVSVRGSLPVAVRIGIETFCCAGSVVSVLVSLNVTVASAPGWRSYGFEAASTVKFAGRPSDTAPLCGSADQLCTTTGTWIVGPLPIDWIACERPGRLACGRVFSSHWSYSAQLPERWNRPSAADTTRTTLSV